MSDYKLRDDVGVGPEINGRVEVGRNGAWMIMDIDKFYDFFEKCEGGEVDALRAEVARLNELLESTKAQLRREQDERNAREVQPDLGPIERWGDVDWPWVECIAKGGGHEAKAARILLGMRNVVGRKIHRLAVSQEKLAKRVAALEDKSKAPTDPEIDEYHRGMSNESLRHIASEAMREAMRSMDARDALQLRVAEFVEWIQSSTLRASGIFEGRKWTGNHETVVRVSDLLAKLRELGLVRDDGEPDENTSNK